MKKKTKSIHEPIGEYRVIKDFLPLPEDLVFKEGIAGHRGETEK